MSGTTLIAYFLLIVSFGVIFLSFTGKTLGIRVICAKILLDVFEIFVDLTGALEIFPKKILKTLIFQWASQLQVEDEEDEEPLDDINDIRISQTDGDDSGISSVTNGGRVVRRTKKIISPNRPLISRQWSSVIDRKLHSDVDTDTETESLAGDSSPPGRHSLDIIVTDTIEFVSAGIESIIDDEVTSRFKAAQLATWNLLSRSRKYGNYSWKLTSAWLFGVIYRYAILFPLRFTVFLVGFAYLLVSSLVIGCIPIERFRFSCNRCMMLTFFRIMSRAAGSIIRFHDTEHRPEAGIVVANHTSPIDVMILNTDNCYALIGQRHGGVLGIIQSAVSRCSHHIWFERSEARDRNLVRKALQYHVNDPDKLPILIFPEGTCINNTGVLLFKKGSFEVADVIFPIAIKYDNRLGDAFWNSSEQNMFMYILSIMTSWALICDVWYLPPVYRKEGEEAADFARRVKHLIAKKGGLVSIDWDGNLKRAMVSQKLKNEQKELLFQYLSRTGKLGTQIDDVAKRLKNTMSLPNMDKLNGANEIVCQG